MKTHFHYHMFLLLLASCVPAVKENHDSDPWASFADSLFNHSNPKVFTYAELTTDYDSAAKKYRLTELSEDHRKLLTDPLFGDMPYSTYYYSRLSPVNSVLPLVILSELTDKSPLHLLLIKADGSVISTIKLVDHHCDTQGIKGEETMCDSRFSVFTDDSTVKVTDVTRYTSAQIVSLDSVVSHFRITQTGELRMLSSDTILLRKP